MRKVIPVCLGLVLIAAARPAPAQAPNPLELRETFAALDSNGNMVLERDEIPEAGLPAFERLLKLGDANKNGRLEADEMRAMAQKLRAMAPLEPAERLRRLKAMDANEDGKISREEFKGPGPLFDRLDADKDGFLTKEEAGRRIEGGPAPATPRPQPPAAKDEPLAPRLQAMDANEDGKISRQEFRGPEGFFGRLDADDDGFITGAEARKAMSGALKGQLKKAARPGAGKKGEGPAKP
jgi:Ca2+-binding EF-hand superfamily protein